MSDQRWLVVVDGTPVRPEHPLPLDEVIDHFRDQAEMSTDGEHVEIRVYEPAEL